MAQLTKREFVAALAMQGYLAGRNNDRDIDSHRPIVAKQCVQYADALLNELNKETP